MVEDAERQENVEDRVDHAERLSSTAGVHRDAWQGTLEDMAALAARREEDGWTVVTIQAGDTGPETAAQGVTDRHGLTFVVPGNQAERFREVFEDGAFPAYDVYRKLVDGRVFLVVELLDPDSETAVLVAGNFWRYQAGAMVEEARDAGHTYTHLRTLDGTHLGSFEHESVEKFFPDPEGVVEDWEAMGGAV